MTTPNNVIQIDTGVKRIEIVRDGEPTGAITFNPSDGLFAEKFYQLIAEFDAKNAEFQNRSDEIDQNKAVDANGIALNTPLKLAMMREACEFIESKIDFVFGAGASNILFGDTINLEMFEMFFNGVTPHIQEARTDKIAKYINPPPPVPLKPKRHKRK
jgi:hypothetical protein